MTTMHLPSLKEIITNNIQLDHSRGNGWHSVACKVCHDHTRKGKRAGFKFDGDVVSYNCFNCGFSAVYDPSTSTSMPHKMVEVLKAFGIPETDWQPVLFTSFSKEHKDVIHKESVSIEPNAITFPSFFYKLTDDKDDEWAQYSIEYLRDKRGIDWTKYPFYLVKKVDHPDNKRWYGRLIIPIYKQDKLIFWQGRDLTDLHSRKYLSVNVPKDNVLYGYENIEHYTDDPLYITEGWFDAYPLNGVAVLGSKVTPSQIKWINRSHRQKVVIPDRYGDGYLLAEQALTLGWSVSLPDIGESCKDVDEAIRKYGKLYVLKSIKDNTFTGFEAEAKVNIYCEHKKREKKNVRR